MPRKPVPRQCPVDYALEVFGDRWTLLVLRDLLLGGKRRFKELLAQREGIATNVLASRLKRLEVSGLVTRQDDPEDGRRVVYEPTDKAIDLIPVLLEISRWSARYDENTAASPNLVARFDHDREQLIAELSAALRTPRR